MNLFRLLIENIMLKMGEKLDSLDEANANTTTDVYKKKFLDILMNGDYIINDFFYGKRDLFVFLRNNFSGVENKSFVINDIMLSTLKNKILDYLRDIYNLTNKSSKEIKITFSDNNLINIEGADFSDKSGFYHKNVSIDFFMGMILSNGYFLSKGGNYRQLNKENYLKLLEKGEYEISELFTERKDIFAFFKDSFMKMNNGDFVISNKALSIFKDKIHNYLKENYDLEKRELGILIYVPFEGNELSIETTTFIDKSGQQHHNVVLDFFKNEVRSDKGILNRLED